jgi:hypothetical protein
MTVILEQFSRRQHVHRLITLIQRALTYFINHLLYLYDVALVVEHQQIGGNFFPSGLSVGGVHRGAHVFLPIKCVEDLLGLVVILVLVFLVLFD